uniref:Putative holin n=1 Tax=viral metagenome TaxID=1070528 RepID=A0A6H1ZM45_9ZZZZ
MAFDPITAILDVGGKLIDKLLPDPEAKMKAKIELEKMAQDGELTELQTRMSAILAEAQSADPWTSRARPSFLYVMYAMILASIPMGVVSAFKPEMATAIAAGMQSWLSSVPAELWTVFGIGYTGYTVARSAWDKKNPK